ncbi:hypothetical protein BDR26DRAFT_860168 [Obelidium mucronatum]|nr:hypothetical protein BDR26DRAFT_860168 [Obelidium mucronatum]
MQPWGAILILALTAAKVVQAQSPSGCYAMTYSPNIVAQSPNLMPRDCIGWCGSNAYAMIAPTPSNAYMYYCACANTKPSAVYSSSYCNFGCPGCERASKFF